MEHHRRIPLPGQRIIRSAVAVALCLIVYVLRGHRGIPLYSALAAMQCMQPYTKDMKGVARKRILGTVIGAVWGLLLLVIEMLLGRGELNEYLHYVLVPIMLVLVLYSTFSQRVFDQLWHDVALQKTHITLCVSHAGIVPGDGVTHQGLYDVSLLARIPGVTIRSPASEEEIPDALRTAVSEGRRQSGEDGDGAGGDPFVSVSVVRYPKGGGIDLAAGGWTLGGGGERRADWRMREIGPDSAAEDRPRTVIVTYGRIAGCVVSAAERVFGSPDSQYGRAAVVLLSRIVPLPEDEVFRTLINAADRLLFAEEGMRSGGVGEALASAPWLRGKYVDIRAVELPFLPHGSVGALTRLAGLDPESLADWMRGGESAKEEQ